MVRVVYLSRSGVRTKRYRDIVISTEQSSNWYFSGVEENSDGKSGWDKGNMNQDQENRLLELFVFSMKSITGPCNDSR